MPCDGKIITVNETLEDEPQAISIAAEEDGWLMEMEIEDTTQLETNLLDEKTYLEYLENLDEDHWAGPLGNLPFVSQNNAMPLI